MGDERLALARLEQVLHDQDGVVTRRQVLACGLTSAHVRRMVRRGHWRPLFPGGYVTHTGAMTWKQRAWAAVLYASPAALSHESALFAATGSGSARGPIHVTVERERNLAGLPGVVVHYRTGLDALTVNVSPPRIRLEETVIDLASTARREIDAIAVLADVVGGRRTTADRLLDVLDRRVRVPRRSFLYEVLCDVRDGACSVLEQRYYVRVERAHGLPVGERQSPTAVGRRGYRDVLYRRYGVVFELDGRLGHDDPLSRDRDMERDLDAAVYGELLTLRGGFGQVFDRACSTALKTAVALVRGGWTGAPHPCRDPNCVVADSPLVSRRAA